jgi:hypothetical protein
LLHFLSLFHAEARSAAPGQLKFDQILSRVDHLSLDGHFHLLRQPGGYLFEYVRAFTVRIVKARSIYQLHIGMWTEVFASVNAHLLSAYTQESTSLPQRELPRYHTWTRLKRLESFWLAYRDFLVYAM